MMDLTQFEKIEPGEIFASGTIEDSPKGINMANTGQELRWIAKKGFGNDWAIYCHWNKFSDETIARMGQKVASNDNIEKLVPCTIEMLNRYRR